MQNHQNYTLSSLLQAIAVKIAAHKWAVIFISILTMILTLYSLKTNPIKQGDGYEYALILQSFFNHFSPDIREADITSLMKIVDSQPSSYDVKVLQGTLEAFRNGDNEIYLGVLKSNRGEYFGYHFWLYPLINLPAKAFLAVFRLNELKAFQLTNSLLIGITLSYVLLFSKQSPVVKWVIATLYLLGCSFFYLQWPHPEVFIAAMIVISGCALLEQRFYVAAIASTLATLQNPSVVFLLAAILILFIAKNFNSDTLKHPLVFIKKHIWMAVIAILTFFPYIFYYYHYQIPNLIVKRGFVDPKLISWSRFTSTLFDLNQGLIVGFPGVMLGVFTILVYRLILVVVKKKRPIFNSSDILLVAFFLMLQPTLSQTNWNHGQEIFSRYTFWAGMALIVWLGANLEEVKNLLKYSLLSIVFLLQLVPNELFFRHPSDGHYVKMKSQAAWVLSNFPSWYNPEPEIFSERVREYEQFGETVAPNRLDSPFIYINETGMIRKILIHKDFVTQTQERLCGTGGKLISYDSQSSIETLLAGISFNRQGWGYINGSFQCVTPVSINLVEGGNSRNFTRQGWGKPDIDGRTIKSQEARFILPLASQKLGDVNLTAKINNLSESQNLPIQLAVIVNGTTVNQWTVNNSRQTAEYQTLIPAKVWTGKSPMSISFRIVGASKKVSETIKLKVVTVKIN
ncbi:hypothetical protein A0J48_025705 [Sphaerospermopsis aphanizomenoides BCCUSP55]|uniref:hypothetical protein n=1 Tax=Sphaerospermopsis aphanizomenoides TaxID=459663 RepID=UPI0019052BE0|nr:hypothetical protein [Sphaerospermopsis aphanizomenoides]MBK1990862.1 hypothetical protein [Sphaerospermopsis aphanizomenoides BCCUSP55]